jgi:hypothetical protein
MLAPTATTTTPQEIKRHHSISTNPTRAPQKLLRKLHTTLQSLPILPPSNNNTNNQHTSNTYINTNPDKPSQPSLNSQSTQTTTDIPPPSTPSTTIKPRHFTQSLHGQLKQHSTTLTKIGQQEIRSSLRNTRTHSFSIFKISRALTNYNGASFRTHLL